MKGFSVVYNLSVGNLVKFRFEIYSILMKPPHNFSEDYMEYES